MLAQLGCAEEDAEVDLELGYPPVYAKLCRHEDAAGLPIPFTEAPPQRFLPYAPHAEDVRNSKRLSALVSVYICFELHNVLFSCGGSEDEVEQNVMQLESMDLESE